jgi:hypothetical protein
VTDRQNTVLATAVAALILVPLFLFPWHVEPGPGAASKELRWSPIYQEPMSYVRSYDAAYGERGSARLEANPATRAWGVLALQLLAIGAVGWVLYVVVGVESGTDDREPPADLPRPGSGSGAL